VTAAKKDILQGWKDIAAYVSRDVRTVKRWEKQRGLPVRRMPGDGRANVYALIPELDSWLSAAGPVESELEDQTAIDEASPVSDLPLEALPPTVLVQPRASAQRFAAHRSWIFAAVGILCVGAITAFGFGIRAHRRDVTAADIPPFNPTQTVHTVRYSSKVPGVDALYLRGIYFYEQRTPDTLDRALRLFQEAIAKDPNYAPAYAGLAQTYNLLREHSMMPEADAYAKAKAAAQHAIALDPNLPDAHAALGFVEFFWDWKPIEAEREFKTSIALDPNSALVHHWYGSMLTHEGRFDESLAQLDLAQRLQPTSPSIVSDRAFALGLSGHRNEAVDALQSIINDDSHSPEPHFVLAVLSLIEPRDVPRYLDEMRRFATLRHDNQRLHALDLVEPAYRKGGPHALWQAMLDQELSLHPSPKDRTVGMADAEALLGLDEQSLRDLAQVAGRHDPTAIGINIDPNLSQVRRDPRFVSIAAEVGLPPPR
jgi:tetratricopeptide (TPR) repeat protein